MTYFYTHISQYLGCPRRYRHRYIDGWREKDTRAAMLFGRASNTQLLPCFAVKPLPLCCSSSGACARTWA